MMDQFENVYMKDILSFLREKNYRKNYKHKHDQYHSKSIKSITHKKSIKSILYKINQINTMLSNYSKTIQEDFSHIVKTKYKKTTLK